MKRSWLFRCMTLLLALLLPVVALAEAADMVVPEEAPALEALSEASEDTEELAAPVEDDGEELPQAVEFLEEDASPLPEEAADDVLADDGVTAEEVQADAVVLESIDLLTDALLEPVEEGPAEASETPAAGDEIPEVTDPEAETPEATDPEAETPEITDPEATDPESETPEATDSEAETPEVTDPESETPEVTEPESETPEVTEPQAGMPEAAEPESGDGEAVALADGDDAAPEVAEAAGFPSALLLGVKESYTLDASGSLKGKIAYISSKPDVVSVNQDTGRLMAKKRGTAKIAAVNAKKQYVTCTVKVAAAPSAVAFAKTKLYLSRGSTCKLPAKLPTGSASHITYASSKAGVAKVDAAGNIRAVKAGTAVITARTYNGKKAACKVTVLNGTAPRSLRLSKSSVTLGVGQKLTLKPVLNAGAAAVYTWTSGNKRVAAVSSGGVVTAKKAGTAKIAVKTHNGLKKICTVRVVKAPGKVTLSPAVLRVAVGGSGKLTAKLPSGTAAGLSWSSANAAVAKVSGGRVTGLKAGTSKVTVKTHNGKTATATVMVVADPDAPAKLTGKFDKSSVSVQMGKKVVIGGSVRAENTLITAVRVTVNGTAGKLSAKLNAVSAVGLQDAACGGAFVVDTTKAPFNKQGTYTLKLYATESTGALSSKALATMTVKVTANTAARMVANLKNSSYLGSKRDGISGIVKLLMDKGYEATFAAGVAANVMCEGDYGYFESSRYATYPKNRPRYFAYLDGGNYYAYKNGTRVLTEVFLSKADAAAYTGSAKASVRYGKANFYLNNYSAKDAWDINLTNLEKLLTNLENGGWKGMFGLGVVQWTAGRTKNLVKVYRKHAGSGATKITKAQVIAAENEMILNELKNTYAYVYNGWKSGGSLTGEASALRAAEIFCRKYEIPAGIEAAVSKRRACAKEIYRIMVS